MKKPMTVVWINRVLLFRLFIILITLLITIIVVYINPASGFFKGFANEILNRSDIANPYEYPDSTAGSLTGIVFIPVMLIIFQLLFLHKRIRFGFWVALGIDLLTTFSYIKFPLIPIVIFLLGISKSTQLYFKSKHLPSKQEQI